MPESLQNNQDQSIAPAPIPVNQSETPLLTPLTPTSIPNTPQIQETPKKPIHRFNGATTHNWKRGPDKERFELARQAVETGMPIPKAMRQAGYTRNTSLVKNNPTRKSLAVFRDKYLMDYASRIKKCGLDGKTVADKLGAIVNGHDDYNAIQAIRAHTMILLKNSNQNHDSIGFLGVFVVPGLQSGENWQKDAQSMQQFQVENLIKSEPIEGEIVDNLVDNSPTLEKPNE